MREFGDLLEEGVHFLQLHRSLGHGAIGGDAPVLAFELGGHEIERLQLSDEVFDHVETSSEGSAT